MTFHSPMFLFIFLPLFILIYWLCGKKLRNAWLMFASLFFYLWGEPLYFPVLVISIFVNHWLAGRIAGRLALQTSHRTWLVLGLAFNLGLLIGFKLTYTYWQPVVDALIRQNFDLPFASWRDYLQKLIRFPLGMSFYTFGMVSYLLDVASRRIQPEPSLSRLAVYVLMFPKVLAGPITTYRELGGQLKERFFTSAGMAGGMRRFITGLSKKVLIADQMGMLLDRGVMELPPGQLGSAVAWLLLVAYALQIYFDFSGYTDMALGVGQMLGFRLPENFNLPYTARSVSDFWRRWHITLSGWFRDYLFYPLERSRAVGRGLPQAANILLVFLATGLWHGLTLNFAAWGLLHGAAIAMERGAFGRWLGRAWRPLQHAYTLLIVLGGWLLFRTSSLPNAWAFLKVLFSFQSGQGVIPFSAFPPIQMTTWMALGIGIIFCTPLASWLANRLQGWLKRRQPAAVIARDLTLIGLLLLSLSFLASVSYQPYIYGAF